MTAVVTVLLLLSFPALVFFLFFLFFWALSCFSFVGV